MCQKQMKRHLNGQPWRGLMSFKAYLVNLGKEQSPQTTTLAQLLLRHVATGSALALGLDAAHFNVHAVSLHAQASAHSWDDAQAESAKQELMASPHLSKPHWHWSGHAAVVQSTAVVEAEHSTFFRVAETGRGTVSSLTVTLMVSWSEQYLMAEMSM